ncbi:MAG: hypothetical protein ABSB74_04475 [Tepidisphaeraceae bacterium]|jgi:hypothetical protein
MPTSTPTSKTHRVVILLQFSQALPLPGGASATGNGSAQLNIDDVPNDIGLDQLSQVVKALADSFRQGGFQVTRVSLTI